MNEIVVIVIKRKGEALDIRAKLIPDKLETYYELLNCTCIDIVRRSIGGRSYEFIVDDEYLLTHEINEPPVAVEGDNEAIFGGIVIAGEVDTEGNLTSLRLNDDLNNVMMNITHFRAEHEGEDLNYNPIFQALKYTF